MTADIVLVLLLLAGAVAAFATGVFRMDITALLVLAGVALLGLAPPERALGGFANPAVIAVGGMYVLSSGLSRTGVADWVGEGLIRWAGGSERSLIVAVTLFSGVLSGFMNNVGVAAMMLPVTINLARKAELAPSKLLIPMALGAQLGGFMTLIGTSPNLLAADVLRDAGREPFTLFSFTPIGAVLLLAGTLFISLAAPRLLPDRTPDDAGTRRRELRDAVDLEERFFYLTIPSTSTLDGVTLGDSLIGSALGVHALAVDRPGDRRESRRLAPGPGTVLRAGDRLLVQGRPDFFLSLRGKRHLTQRGQAVPVEWLESGGRGVALARVAPGSPIVGSSVSSLDFRAKEGVLVLSLLREGFRRRTHLQDTEIRVGDELLLHGPIEKLAGLADTKVFEEVKRIAPEEAVRRFELGERLWSLLVTADSLLAGRKLGETRLGDAIGMMVLAIGRDEGSVLLPGPDTELEPGDHLLVKTRAENLAILRGLQRLDIELDPELPPDTLESATAGFVEVVLAPRSSLIGKTLRQANFRGRFGMHVVAVIREGETLRANLRDETLRFGDALLLHGPRRKARTLGREPDLIPLNEPEAGPPDVRLAPRSIVVVAAALVPVILGLVPVAVGVVAGAVAMVVTRCLTPEEAYRAVEWPVLVLMAGMLALGAALDASGAARMLGTGIMAMAGPLGPHGLLAFLVGVAALAAQVMPGPAVIVLMGPIAVAGGLEFGVAPEALVLGVAIASTSLASPVSQPAHALVMAPAGYRPADYLRLGVPITLLVLVITVVLAPIVFAF